MEKSTTDIQSAKDQQGEHLGYSKTQLDALKVDPDLKEFIDTFNQCLYCNCCPRHQSEKPVEITETYWNGNYYGDSRDYHGPVGGCHENWVIDYHKYISSLKKPVFTHFMCDDSDCMCNCRHQARKMVLYSPYKYVHAMGRPYRPYFYPPCGPDGLPN